MGFSSGEYGGKKRGRAPTVFNKSLTSLMWCIRQLSIITTSPGFRVRHSFCPKKYKNLFGIICYFKWFIVWIFDVAVI